MTECLIFSNRSFPKKRCDAVSGRSKGRSVQRDKKRKQCRKDWKIRYILPVNRRISAGIYLLWMFFCFPSVFEGVPFALIEAQANGLACVMSEAVSEEAVVFPERVRRLSLDRDNIQWAAAVMAMSSMNREAADLIKMRLSDAHFNIETEAKNV